MRSQIVIKIKSSEKILEPSLRAIFDNNTMANTRKNVNLEKLFLLWFYVKIPEYNNEALHLSVIQSLQDFAVAEFNP